MRCAESKGTVVRRVRFVELTMEKLLGYYNRLKEFDAVFNDDFPNDPIAFGQLFLNQSPNGFVQARGLIWEVDDVGILYLTNIGVKSATAHFTFWDQRIRGREPLIRAMIKYGMKEYGFERIETRAALYATRAIRAVERIGFVKEGRLRKSVSFKGELFDAYVYSLLREEVL